MAAKKTGSKASKTESRGSTAADFVRGLPSGISAKDAVEKAKAAGVKLTTAYFYVLKSTLGLSGGKRGKPGPKAKGKPGPKPAVKAKGKPGPKAKGKPGPKAKGKPGPKPKGAGLLLSSRDKREQTIINTLKSLGLARVRSIISAYEALGGK